MYDNPWVRLTLVDIEPPDGNRFEHHVVRLQRVAIALVLDEADEVLMMWRPSGGVRRVRGVRSLRCRRHEAECCLKGRIILARAGDA